MTSTAGGFASAETFPCTVTMGAWVRRWIPSSLGPLIAILLLFALLLHALGAGLLGWPWHSFRRSPSGL